MLNSPSHGFKSGAKLRFFVETSKFQVYFYFIFAHIE